MILIYYFSLFFSFRVVVFQMFLPLIESCINILAFILFRHLTLFFCGEMCFWQSVAFIKTHCVVCNVGEDRGLVVSREGKEDIDRHICLIVTLNDFY